MNVILVAYSSPRPVVGAVAARRASGAVAIGVAVSEQGHRWLVVEEENVTYGWPENWGGDTAGELDASDASELALEGALFRLVDCCD